MRSSSCISSHTKGILFSLTSFQFYDWKKRDTQEAKPPDWNTARKFPTECKNERQNWISTNLKFWEKTRLWPSILVQHYPSDSFWQLDRAASLVPVQRYKNLKIVSKAKKEVNGEEPLCLWDTLLMHWLVYKVITEWWMGATTPFSLLRCLFLRHQWYNNGVCGVGVNLSYPCPSYGQCSHWPWLSNAVTHALSSTLSWHQFLFPFGMLLNPTKLGSFQQLHPLRNDPFRRAHLPLSFP